MEVKKIMMNIQVNANDINAIYSAIKAKDGISMNELSAVLPNKVKLIKVTDLLALHGKIMRGISREKGQPIKRIFVVV